MPIFINDELVTFGQTYAQENGYRIDEMGILALYSRIDSLQREDHAVTVAEVKEVMDEAIQHSQKASAPKYLVSFEPGRLSWPTLCASQRSSLQTCTEQTGR